MNTNKVASELVRLAKVLTADSNAESLPKEHRKEYENFDRAFEKYQEYVRTLPASSAKKEMLKAMQAIIVAYVSLNGELLKQTNDGRLLKQE